MKQVQLLILNESRDNPAGMVRFLAALTQRGHKIANACDLLNLYEVSQEEDVPPIKNLMNLPHGSIKRHTPVTVAIVGASRRFLAQARTHSVGIDFVSASLQYSDYSNDAEFYIPYEYFVKPALLGTYLASCKEALSWYKYLVDKGISNDTAGYSMIQGMRNVLIVTANHEAWLNFIRLRMCNRNTDEMQFVAAKLWELLFTYGNDGHDMFSAAGPDCLHGKCREGNMSCKQPICKSILQANNPASAFIKERWPLLYEDNN